MGRVWSQTRPGPQSAARKMPSPPKIMFRDAGDLLDLKVDGGLEGSDVAGMDPKEFAWGEIADD